MTRVLVHDPPELDPEAPGLDEDTRHRRRSLAKMRKLSLTELQNLAVRAGILTPDGDLTEPYKDTSPSPYREALSDSSLDVPGGSPFDRCCKPTDISSSCEGVPEPMGCE